MENPNNKLHGILHQLSDEGFSILESIYAHPQSGDVIKTEDKVMTVLARNGDNVLINEDTYKKGREQTGRGRRVITQDDFKVEIENNATQIKSVERANTYAVSYFFQPKDLQEWVDGKIILRQLEDRLNL